jgi:hypothetical protein
MLREKMKTWATDETYQPSIDIRKVDSLTLGVAAGTHKRGGVYESCTELGSVCNIVEKGDVNNGEVVGKVSVMKDLHDDHRLVLIRRPIK